MSTIFKKLSGNKDGTDLPKFLAITGQRPHLKVTFTSFEEKPQQDERTLEYENERWCHCYLKPFSQFQSPDIRITVTV